MKLLLVILAVIGLAAIAMQPEPPPAPTVDVDVLLAEVAACNAKLAALEKICQAAPKQIDEQQKKLAELTTKVAQPPEQNLLPERERLKQEYPSVYEQLADHETDLARLNALALDQASQIASLQDAAKTCPLPTAKTPAKSPAAPLSAYDAAIARATATGQQVLFVLSQPNCFYCDQLAANVLRTPQFEEGIASDFVLSEIDIKTDAESGRHFTVTRTPAALVFDPKTNAWKTVPGPPRNTAAFLAVLKGMK